MDHKENPASTLKVSIKKKKKFYLICVGLQNTVLPYLIQTRVDVSE